MWEWIMSTAHFRLCDIDGFSTMYVIASEAGTATAASAWKFLFARDILRDHMQWRH